MIAKGTEGKEALAESDRAQQVRQGGEKKGKKGKQEEGKMDKQVRQGGVKKG